MKIFGSFINAPTVVGTNYAQAECKRHDLAEEKLQKGKDK